MANELADALSPYLRQHAGNPVDWREWGGPAFAEARERDLPIFLSVGYAACHWCHVMAHESFEDPAVAAFLAEHFVSIKVDREERPDVDALYMTATQALTGQGGWPMSVFLTPDGRPFYAGTYFPPQPAHGIPAFGQVIQALAQAWRTDRPGIEATADRIATGIRKAVEPGAGGSSGDPAQTHAGAGPASSPVDLVAALDRLERECDRANGGFGGAPKFPPALALDGLQALADRFRADGDDDRAGRAERMIDDALAAMARGGIADLLGGGFARYSVDRAWVVPHFEKMLYDNALLLGTYARRFGRTGDERFARAAAGIVGWLEHDLRTEEGAYASSLDADSIDPVHGGSREGAFYAWTPADLAAALDGEEELASRAAHLLGVTETGTFEHGASTLRLVDGADAGETFNGLRPVLERLAVHRAATRPRPARDDKVVAAWNGLAVSSLVAAARVLERPEWLGVADRVAEAVWRVHVDPSSGRVARASRDGVASTAPGTLQDAAALTHAAVSLAAALAGDDLGRAEIWLDRARLLADAALERFAAPDGGWYDTAGDGSGASAGPEGAAAEAAPAADSAAADAAPDAASASPAAGTAAREPDDGSANGPGAATATASATADAPPLFARLRDVSDNVEPSGTSLLIAALRLLAKATGEQRYADAADRAAPTARTVIAQSPRFAGWALADAATAGPRERLALPVDEALGPDVAAAVFPGIPAVPLPPVAVEIAVVGGDAELRRAAVRFAPAGSLVVTVDAGDASRAAGRVLPVLEGREAPGAYVCRGFVCDAPVHSASALRTALARP